MQKYADFYEFAYKWNVNSLNSHFKTKSIDKEISKIALKLSDYVNKVFFAIFFLIWFILEPNIAKFHFIIEIAFTMFAHIYACWGRAIPGPVVI